MTLNNTHRLLAGALALVLVAGMTSPAFANPMGDTVLIEIDGIPADPQIDQVEVVPGAEFEFVNLLDGTLITVDIEDGAIWIEFPRGVDAPIPYTIHIEDIDWLDENGNEVPGEIVDLFCEAFVLSDPLGIIPGHSWSNTPDGSIVWIDVDPNIFTQPGIPASIHCEYTTEHVEDSLVAGQLLPLESTSLMIAGLTSMSVWMIPTVAGLAGAGVYLVKFRKH